MAIAFVAASSQFLEATTTPVTTTPLTIVGWFRTTNIVANQTICSVVDGATNTNGFYLEASGANANDPLSATTATGSTFNSALFNNYTSTGAWAFGVGVFTSATQRDVYLNGVLGTTNATSTTPAATPSRIGIGCLDRSTRTSFFGGDLAEVGVYNVALTQADVTALYNNGLGLRLFRYQPKLSALKVYAPMRDVTSPSPDYFNAAGFSLNAAPTKATTNPDLDPLVTLQNNLRPAIFKPGIAR